ncbi:MAG: DUF1592 domain-containing protein [Verrucomicrobia bacterium]|nr:DUF1592 domain-containing protein [Verrucomicrobiota bacterium]
MIRRLLVPFMHIRFVDISKMLRLTDPRSGARLCEAQQLKSLRLSTKRISMVQFFLVAAFGLISLAEDSISFSSDVRPLLQEYCFKCHGSNKPKGGINIEKFAETTDVYRDPKLWEMVFKQVNEREMPPDGKPQPSDSERRRITDWLRHTLDNLDHGAIPRDPGRVLIHRLSRLEYNNTVRDLFGVTTRPADKFPADGGGGGGFDNIADTLFVPPILMERFLEAAEEILEASVPERILIFRPKDFDSEASAAQKIIEQIAPRAYRRPVELEEIALLMSLYEEGTRLGLGFEDSVKLALKAVLVSPKFLFRTEVDQPGDAPYRINDYELASRLSYFLWSSMPDDELFALAKDHRLSHPPVLKAQAERMILDPKSDAFASNFARQWLRVEELLLSAKPDPRRYPDFTDELRDAMMAEPVAMFRSILRENASLLDLIDSDYTFANEILARHYGIQGISGAGFQRAPLPDKNRGGVLGMGAVLTLTSYPRRTSPVLRGKWVLEELLGTPPPPPPPMVKSLPRDDRPVDGLTLRQQLEKHRSDPSCANCHKRMDPLGLGLENFDAVGQWRTEISGIPIDSSGTMATGEAFNGPEELRRILLGSRDDFVRNLTEKMLSYALGRGLDYYDTPAVRQIARTVASSDFRSSVLVNEIVGSFPFQYRRNKPVASLDETNNDEDK